MKNKCLLYIIITVLVIIFSSCSGCLDNSREKIIGTWERSDGGGKLVFDQNGTLIQYLTENQTIAIHCTYEIDNNHLTITTRPFADKVTTIKADFEFIESTILKIYYENGQIKIYHKLSEK